MFLVTLLVLKTNLNAETRTEKKEEWKNILYIHRYTHTHKNRNKK